MLQYIITSTHFTTYSLRSAKVSMGKTMSRSPGACCQQPKAEMQVNCKPEQLGPIGLYTVSHKKRSHTFLAVT